MCVLRDFREQFCDGGMAGQKRGTEIEILPGIIEIQHNSWRLTYWQEITRPLISSRSERTDNRTESNPILLHLVFCRRLTMLVGGIAAQQDVKKLKK